MSILLPPSLVLTRANGRLPAGVRFACAALAYLATLLASPAWAAPTLESVQAQLAKSPVVRGTFLSVREVAGLKLPLRSSGRFLLAQGQGLVWSQEQPFPQGFTVTRAFLRQEAPGTPPRTLRATDNPVAAMVGGLLLSLFSGDTRQVAQDFTVRFTPLADLRWRIDCTPQRPPLSQMFQSIRVSGTEVVDEVELIDPHGDRTLIQFQNVRTSPAELTDAEQSAFRP